MSFLEELATRKRSLKPAETRVTTCTGAQYVEPRSEIHSNAKQSFSGRPPNLILQPTACSGYVVDEKPDLQVGQVTENLLIGRHTLPGKPEMQTIMSDTLLMLQGQQMQLWIHNSYKT